jgi:hypothetical protein
VDLYAPTGEPKRSRFVALGKTVADLEADSATLGHREAIPSSEAGCLNRRAYPSSFLAMTTRWTWLVPS